MSYRSELVGRFWDYQQIRLHDPALLDAPRGQTDRPPVFVKSEAARNVIVNPAGSPDERGRLLGLIPVAQRHKWFRSMTSSQALAQSVLGNLAVTGRLDVLLGVVSDEGTPLIPASLAHQDRFSMEFSVSHLGEPRPTSVDAMFVGDHQRVALECKLSEPDVGHCSRPGLDANDPEYCDGSLPLTRNSIDLLGPVHRCPLTSRGVRYWDYVPVVFNWPVEADMIACPLHTNYQLVRNVLAACVQPSGTVSPDNGYAVVVYDERNPAFREGGKGDTAFTNTKSALRPGYGNALRRCSWQRIMTRLRDEGGFEWLTSELELKYGL